LVLRIIGSIPINAINVSTLTIATTPMPALPPLADDDARVDIDGIMDRMF
jgi:hypothetical protein